MFPSFSRKYKLLVLAAVILAVFVHRWIARSQDVERLVQQLEDGSLEQQIDAARALGELGSSASDALDPLEKAVKDPSAELRAEAIRAVIFIDSREAVAILSDAFTDRDPGVRIDAAEALEQLGTAQAQNILASRRAVSEKRYERAALGDWAERLRKDLKTSEKKSYKAHLKKYSE